MHFVITFGFLIPMKSDTNVENDEGTVKSKVNRKRKQQRKKKTVNKNTRENEKSKQNIINVDQILAEIHVEYELLPGYTYKFDCRCWKTATKIYTENGDSCLRPILCPITENAFWVIFSVHHVVHLNEAQIQQFFNYVITYQMFSGRNKFSERAKKDKVKGFYIDEKSINIGQHDFLEIYPLDLRESKSITKPQPEPIIVTHETHGDFSIATYLNVIPDSVHQCKFWKMIRKERFPSESLKFELSTTLIEQKSKLKERENPGKKKQLKEKKSKRGKQGSETIHVMNLPMETLFSDMGTITCHSRTSKIPSVSSILIYTQCGDILSNKQLRMNLNPISIKLEQISNFPNNITVDNGFNYLYAKILFVDRTIVTPYYVPARTIYFEFIKCFLSEEFQAEELISFLETKFLTVEIIGTRATNVAKSPVSTPRKLDHDDSVKIKSPRAETPAEVLLGVAEFDVSDLLRGLWEIRLTGSLSHPCNIYCISNQNDEGATVPCKNSPLTNDILTSFGTSVKIKVRLACDLRAVHRKVLRHVITLNRIFLILNNPKLFNDILADVRGHNCSLFCILQCSNEDADFKGLSNGYLLKIWEMVAKLPVEDGCVHYNSGCVFLSRLYENFMPLGGVLKVKLSEPLETQLCKHDLYIGKIGTTVQAKAIRTMGLMKLALTMKSLSQKCLFPDSNSVKAFIDEIHENYL